MDIYLKSKWQKISKFDKLTFLFGFIACLICNMYAATNGLHVHDGMNLFDESSGIANGRLFVDLLLPVINRTSIP